MKKWFTLCMAALLLLGVFAGCTKGGSGGETTTAETTTSPLETKSAAITGNTAIRLLESYSKKELGLDNVGKKKYEFMLSTIGSEIKGKKYIRAEAGYMDQTGKDENGNSNYENSETHDTVIVKADMATGELVRYSRPLKLGHSNDGCYNSRTGLITVSYCGKNGATGETRYNRACFIDPGFPSARRALLW